MLFCHFELHAPDVLGVEPYVASNLFPVNVVRSRLRCFDRGLLAFDCGNKDFVASLLQLLLLNFFFVLFDEVQSAAKIAEHGCFPLDFCLS